MEKLEGNIVLKYPRNVTINFRKLDKPTLIRILRFYGVSPNANLTQSEIAAMTARVFHASAVSDTDILDKFGAKFFGAKNDTTKNPTSKKRSYSSRETLDSVPARCGEQVLYSLIVIYVYCFFFSSFIDLSVLMLLLYLTSSR